jgi:hypothetical protein
LHPPTHGSPGTAPIVGYVATVTFLVRGVFAADRAAGAV